MGLNIDTSLLQRLFCEPKKLTPNPKPQNLNPKHYTLGFINSYTHPLPTMTPTSCLINVPISYSPPPPVAAAMFLHFCLRIRKIVSVQQVELEKMSSNDDRDYDDSKSSSHTDSKDNHTIRLYIYICIYVNMYIYIYTDIDTIYLFSRELSRPCWTTCRRRRRSLPDKGLLGFRGFTYLSANLRHSVPESSATGW